MMTAIWVNAKLTVKSNEGTILILLIILVFQISIYLHGFTCESDRVRKKMGAQN